MRIKITIYNLDFAKLEISCQNLTRLSQKFLKWNLFGSNCINFSDLNENKFTR